MSGRIVARAPVAHRCDPGWVDIGDFMRPVQSLPGDVWRCECGIEWTASDAASNYATVGQRSVNAVEWKRRKRHRSWFGRRATAG